ncbi:MAG: hypothetical protein R2856_32960 [Caldilineaceae bacterium]
MATTQPPAPTATATAGAAAPVPNAPAAATLPASDAYFSFDNASSRLTDSAGRQATTRADRLPRRRVSAWVRR